MTISYNCWSGEI